jgi:hypothetical protein
MRKEAFKSKGHTGVDVFKVTQTLPVCKGKKTRRAGLLKTGLLKSRLDKRDFTVSPYGI